MGAAPRRWAAEILYQWFHRLGPGDWFGGGEQVDRLLAARFADDWRRLRQCRAEDFLARRDIARAAILLFDQVPRNMFRDDPRAFASDPLARAVCRGALARGWHIGLDPHAVQFLAMPLMHSEDIADQQLSLAVFAAHAPHALPFARSHHRMIARFGRFPIAMPCSVARRLPPSSAPLLRGSAGSVLLRGLRGMIEAQIVDRADLATRSA